MGEVTKKCKTCGHLIPLERLLKSPRYRLGYRPFCDDCVKKQTEKGIRNRHRFMVKKPCVSKTAVQILIEKEYCKTVEEAEAFIADCRKTNGQGYNSYSTRAT